MRWFFAVASLVLLVLIAGTVFMGAEEKDRAAKSPWLELEAGLELGVFPSPQAATSGDSMIRLLRIDPQRFTFELHSAAADQTQPMTARQWSEAKGLVAVINASMYQEDRRTSVSLMRTRNWVNNPRLSKDKTIFAFDRRRAESPPVKIIDRECDSFERWRPRYGTEIQSIRMLSCRGKNVWQQQDKKWSTAALGTDGEGRVFFIHVRSPYSTHDLIHHLRKLPVGIERAMYVEGGAEAQLFIHSGDATHEFVGVGAAGLSQNNFLAWPVPNVIGIRRK